MTGMQQWGLKAANDAIGERPNHVDPIYWLDTRDNFARALVAADKAATERERELIATYIEQRDGSIPDRQEIAAAIPPLTGRQ